MIAAISGEEEREYWQRTFLAPEDVELKVIQPVLPVRVYPDAIDSHFHMDRTLRNMGLSLHGSLDEIIDNAPVDGDKRINFVGAVAIYCDPRTYPADRYLQQMPRHISVGLVFDPKHACRELRMKLASSKD